MIGQLENTPTQSMQCDLLTEKIGKPQIPRPEEGKKTYLGSLLSLEVVIQQPLVSRKRFVVASWCHPSSQSASCLAASALCLQMNCRSHFLSSERRKFLSLFFLYYWFITAGKGTYTFVPTENIPLSISRTSLFLPVEGVTWKSQTSVWNAIKVMISRFYIVFCINDIKMFCSCTCLLFTLA